MKTLVVYDSFFGCTEKIAQAIGDALGTAGDVAVVRVTDVQPAQLAAVGLLIVGSPTRQLRPSPATTGLLKNLPANSLRGVQVAAFDTRLSQEHIDKIRPLAWAHKLFGYAAHAIAKLVQKKGGALLVPAEGFYVSSDDVPVVLAGELERAVVWARQLGQQGA